MYSKTQYQNAIDAFKKASPLTWPKYQSAAAEDPLIEFLATPTACESKYSQRLG